MALESWFGQSPAQFLKNKMASDIANAKAVGITVIDLSVPNFQGVDWPWSDAVALFSNKENIFECQNTRVDSREMAELVRDFTDLCLGKHDGAPAEYESIFCAKPLTELIPLACGCDRVDVDIYATTPGYYTPAAGYDNWRGVKYQLLNLNRTNEWRFRPSDLYSTSRPDSERMLVMMDYPHGPSGQVATYHWLDELCIICERNNIRLFNNAEHIVWSMTPNCTSLAEVAAGFPGLSWAEACSVTPFIGGNGWQIGSVIGSPDFIQDIAGAKGNAVYGWSAAMCLGVLKMILQNNEGFPKFYRHMFWLPKYRSGMESLIELLVECGLRIAVMPKAGLVSLWRVPSYAFGERISSAVHFNDLMITRTGLMGTPFDSCIQYALVDNLADVAKGIKHAFCQANILYSFK